MAGDDLLVARGIDLLHVIEQAATLADHFEEAATRMIVLGVQLEVICQTVNARGEQRDRKSTRLNSSHLRLSRMPSSA